MSEPLDPATLLVRLREKTLLFAVHGIDATSVANAIKPRTRRCRIQHRCAHRVARAVLRQLVGDCLARVAADGIV